MLPWIIKKHIKNLLCLTDALYIRVCVKHFGMANIKKKLNIGNALAEHLVCSTVDLNALLVCNFQGIQHQNN